MKNILLIAVYSLFTNFLMSQEGLKLEELDSVSRLIVEDVASLNGIHSSATIIERVWYNADEGGKIASDMNAMFQKQTSELLDAFGVPQGKSRLCLSTRLGPYLAVIYLKEYSLLPLPVRITWYKKDNMYYLLQIARGTVVFSDIFNYATVTMGKIAPEVQMP